MKIYPVGITTLLVLVIAAFVYEHQKTAQLESKLDVTAKDHATMGAQVKELNRQIRERPREVTSPPEPAPSTAPVQPVTRPATPTRVAPVATPGVSITAPSGWTKNGGSPGAYVVGVDQLQTWGGMPSAYVKSNAASPNEFGGMMQKTSAEDFIGKRVRLSGWIKTEEANDGGGHLWLRVDGQQAGMTLQFDNMDNRPVKGTSDWQECSIVVDVPAGSAALAYGFFVKGGGKMWVSGTKLEPVGPEVPSTNTMTIAPPAAQKLLPKTPVNLGFFPDQPK